MSKRERENKKRMKVFIVSFSNEKMSWSKLEYRMDKSAVSLVVLV